MGSAKATTNHDEIRQWVEARGGKPVTAKRAEHGGEPGPLRIDFPTFSEGDAFEEITWDEWFEQFDEKNLAALYEAEAASAETSQVIKLVDRERVEQHSKPQNKY